MIGGKMIGHRPISTSQHHPGAQRRQLRTGAIEAEQGQRGHGGRKPGKGMNLATSPQNECENRRRRPSRGLAHTPGTPIFALFRWTSERAASIRCPDGGSGQGSFASFLKGPLPPSGHRIERRTIDLQSDINCLPERSLLGAFGKQHDDYDHDVFNSAGSTLATPHFGPENGVHLTATAPALAYGYLVLESGRDVLLPVLVSGWCEPRGGSLGDSRIDDGSGCGVHLGASEGVVPGCAASNHLGQRSSVHREGLQDVHPHLRNDAREDGAVLPAIERKDRTLAQNDKIGCPASCQPQKP